MVSPDNDGITEIDNNEISLEILDISDDLCELWNEAGVYKMSGNSSFALLGGVDKRFMDVLWDMVEIRSKSKWSIRQVKYESHSLVGGNRAFNFTLDFDVQSAQKPSELRVGDLFKHFEHTM